MLLRLSGHYQFSLRNGSLCNFCFCNQSISNSKIQLDSSFQYFISFHLLTRKNMKLKTWKSSNVDKKEYFSWMYPQNIQMYEHSLIKDFKFALIRTRIRILNKNKPNKNTESILWWSLFSHFKQKYWKTKLYFLWK